MCLKTDKAIEGSPGIAHFLMKSSCPQTLTKNKWRTSKASLGKSTGRYSQRAGLQADRWAGQGAHSTASVGSPVSLPGAEICYVLWTVTLKVTSHSVLSQMEDFLVVFIFFPPEID